MNILKILKYVCECKDGEDGNTEQQRERDVTFFQENNSVKIWKINILNSKEEEIWEQRQKERVRV